MYSSNSSTDHSRSLSFPQYYPSGYDVNNSLLPPHQPLKQTPTQPRVYSYIPPNSNSPLQSQQPLPQQLRLQQIQQTQLSQQQLQQNNSYNVNMEHQSQLQSRGPFMSHHSKYDFSDGYHLTPPIEVTPSMSGVMSSQIGVTTSMNGVMSSQIGVTPSMNGVMSSQIGVTPSMSGVMSPRIGTTFSPSVRNSALYAVANAPSGFTPQVQFSRQMDSPQGSGALNNLDSQFGVYQNLPQQINEIKKAIKQTKADIQTEKNSINQLKFELNALQLEKDKQLNHVLPPLAEKNFKEIYEEVKMLNEQFDQLQIDLTAAVEERKQGYSFPNEISN